MILRMFKNTQEHRFERIDVTRIGSGVKARLAAYGMKWGYNAQLDKLATLLASPQTEA